jgi:hypothetical protein
MTAMYLSLLIFTQQTDHCCFFFIFNMSTDGGSNYNVTKTTTVFQSEHDEADTSTALSYNTSHDLAQSTAFQLLANYAGNGNDENTSGTLTLFNPSSTTYVKHFISDSNVYHADDFMQNWKAAGYGNTTSAINAIQFKFASGNIDSGIIKLYGIGG